MPSAEQIWFSPNCDKRRWAAWLRTGVGVRARAPDLRAPDLSVPAKINLKSDQRVVWIVDAQRDDLEKLREVAGKLPQVRLIGVIGKNTPPSGKKIARIEWFAWVSRDSARHRGKNCGCRICRKHGIGSANRKKQSKIWREPSAKWNSCTKLESRFRRYATQTKC